MPFLFLLALPFVGLWTILPVRLKETVKELTDAAYSNEYEARK